MDPIQRRLELADALTAHDITRVRRYLHADFIVRDSDDNVVIDHAGLMIQLPIFFAHHPEYSQSVKVETSHIDANRAELVTRHIETLRTWRRAHEVPSRWDETWLKAGDEWLLLQEKPHAE